MINYALIILSICASVCVKAQNSTSHKWKTQFEENGVKWVSTKEPSEELATKIINFDFTSYRDDHYSLFAQVSDGAVLELYSKSRMETGKADLLHPDSMKEEKMKECHNHHDHDHHHDYHREHEPSEPQTMKVLKVMRIDLNSLNQ